MTQQYAFKTYKKINLYSRQHGRSFYWMYECSTMASKTCKEAKKAFCARHSLDETQVKASFSK